MARNTYHIGDYKSADSIFNQRGPVRSKKWSIDQRPLDPKPSTQRRLIHVQTPDAEYYDVKLYNTVMARFYKPTVENGQTVERRLYIGQRSITGKTFMWRVLNVFGRSHYDAHKIIPARKADTMVPVYSKPFMWDNGVEFSLDATFVDGKLDITRSRHTPHYRIVADKSDKARKAALIKKFENYIMLAQMRMPEFAASAKMDRNLGRPWGGEGYNARHLDAVRQIESGEERQEDIDTFFAMCQSAYNVLASKRGVDQGVIKYTYWNQPKAKDPTPDDLERPITTDDLRRAIITRITNFADVSTKSHREEVPQFPMVGDYPRSNLWV